MPQLAVTYGADCGHVFDAYLRAPVTGDTFRFFSMVLLVGLLLLAARWVGRLG